MRPVRPESQARTLGRVSKKVGALQRRDVGGTTNWVDLEEPYDNDWEWPGAPYVKPAWKRNPNPGKHPFLRGSVTGGVSGTSPFTLPSEAGAPFDGTAVYASALTNASGLAITSIDEDGVVTVFEFTVGYGPGGTDVAIVDGGTGASTASAARDNLGLEIGVDVASQSDVDGVVSDLAAHLADGTDAHDASAVSVLDTGNNFTGTNVETVLAEVFAALGAHEADTTDAHDASAISVADGGSIFVGTNVETVLAEILGVIAAHVADSSAAHAAVSISFDPTGTGLSSTDVQNAIEELDMGGGGGGGGAPSDIQSFTAGTGQTWTKPTGAPAMTVAVLVGPGGAGGGGPSAVNTAAGGGAGGGGGSVKVVFLKTSTLGATENVDVGAGGTGGAGGTARGSAGVNAGSQGDNGSGPTSFGSHASAYAGGGGTGGNSINVGSGAGASMASSANHTASAPPSTATNPSGGLGANSASGIDGICTEWGGASGAGSATSTVRNGGSSIFGGPGGGSGGHVSAANVGTGAGTGGATASYTAGGGGAAGTSGATPTAGADGTFTGPYCGEGGGGGGAGSGVAGAKGGKGGRGAGGGGGGPSSHATSAAAGAIGGDGGDGSCIVTTWY